MDPESLFTRYQGLQQYVGWTPEDRDRIVAVADLLEPHFPTLVEDFYEEIDRHPDATKVFTGGEAQVERLKGALHAWLRQLVAGRYDRDYVAWRWHVGRRHAEIGLEQVYTNVALSRLRLGLVMVMEDNWRGSVREQRLTVRALHKLLDLDLAILEQAYQSEHFLRQQEGERMSTMGHMAGGVAHELRQPLNVIGSSAYYLQHARKASPEKINEHLQRIRRQVELANGVITAMSSFARLALPDMQPVALEICLKKTMEMVPPRGNIEVITRGAVGLSPVLGDVEQLRIVFANLIRNAADAMPRGGQVTIDAHETEGHVTVDVHDAGRGIAPEDLSRVMQPMYTTKARGIGLGLTLVRAILEKHNGQIRVRSEPGRGSTFTVSLPIAAVDAAETETETTG